MERILLVSPNCADLAAPNIEIRQFPDLENYLRIPQIDKVKDKEVCILHRCYPNQDSKIFQLLQIIEAVRPAAKKVCAIVPYLPYARQDDVHLHGEVKTAEMLCKTLLKAGLDELVTFDCHFIKEGPGRHEYAGLSIDNRTMGPELLAYLKPLANNPVIISPDIGAAYMVKEEGGVSMEKKRGEYVKGETIFREVIEEKLDFGVGGRDVVIIDDIIAVGDTMIKAAQACKKGKAKRIICAAVHGLLLSCAFDKIRAAGAREVIVTDSIPSPAAVVSIRRGLQDFL